MGLGFRARAGVGVGVRRVGISDKLQNVMVTSGYPNPNPNPKGYPNRTLPANGTPASPPKAKGTWGED